jgi:2-polyprenyl-6-hydroxyphenyl methylase/3-demethylubiquinone-9 3-methyltransferase
MVIERALGRAATGWANGDGRSDVIVSRTVKVTSSPCCWAAATLTSTKGAARFCMLSMQIPVTSWRTHRVAKNTICLWYDGTALSAAQFYAETFPDSAVGIVHRAPGDYPAGKQGDVLTVQFTVIGIPCLGLNGGPAFRHHEAFSFQVATDDQAETDRLWHALVSNGGQESACGWCRDKWGISWQITPRALTEAITDPDRAAVKRAFAATMQLRKIDMAVIDAARRG